MEIQLRNTEIGGLGYKYAPRPLVARAERGLMTNLRSGGVMLRPSTTGMTAKNVMLWRDWSGDL